MKTPTGPYGFSSPGDPLRNFLSEVRQKEEERNKIILDKWKSRFPHLKTDAEVTRAAEEKRNEFRQNWSNEIAPLLEKIWDKKPEECTEEDVRFAFKALLIHMTESDLAISEDDARKELIEDFKAHNYLIPADLS